MKNRHVMAMVVMVCALWAACLRPAQAGIAISIGISGPQYAFSFGGNLNAYYWPAYQTYLYADAGLYYRWVDGAWVYAPAPLGPWMPLSPVVFLPPPLLYGPPPPVVFYRPYFLWWRMAVGPWYARAHPGWWMQHRVFLARYAIWRARVIPFYAAHPDFLWRRPGMRPVFTRPFIRQQRWRYALHHPAFAAHHPMLRAHALRYAAHHPGIARRGFVRRGPPMMRRGPQFHRFMAHHPRLRGHPYRARRAFRARRRHDR